jgi:cystathionine gamma-synthase
MATVSLTPQVVFSTESGGALSSATILRFPPNFVRQLSTKARRNCSNIGVAQIVAAAWSDCPAAASAAAEVSAIPNAKVAQPSAVVQAERNLLGSDASLAVHAGERLGRRIATDAITTPVVNTSAYWFNNSQELIDFKEGRHASFEYGRYGNPTTEALEKKMSALEKAESTVFVASGMYAAVAMLSALVPAGGHIVTTTDCYRKTRIYMENELPKRGVSMTVIRPADMDALQNALDSNNVSVIITISFIPILMNLSLQTYLMVMFRYLFSSPRLLRIHFSDALMSSLSQICAIARELCFALTVLLPPL